ncbi:hypothetical protein AVEN_226938-1 [Araneus ventricosus]|uniref:Uncharacterized protein n=1 Tax=Araneus ventricosus TaxID=182803 RepID=A0A4Y2LDG8_ARAVE|nr:hypothetical protein AVEN_226938-1 [Araneus ventricosus]
MHQPLAQETFRKAVLWDTTVSLHSKVKFFKDFSLFLQHAFSKNPFLSGLLKGFEEQIRTSLQSKRISKRKKHAYAFCLNLAIPDSTTATVPINFLNAEHVLVREDLPKEASRAKVCSRS